MGGVNPLVSTWSGCWSPSSVWNLIIDIFGLFILSYYFLFETPQTPHDDDLLLLLISLPSLYFSLTLIS
jgi:asparagine N-glycosylation enzyme membrane subunit Stt3